MGIFHVLAKCAGGHERVRSEPHFSRRSSLQCIQNRTQLRSYSRCNIDLTKFDNSNCNLNRPQICDGFKSIVLREPRALTLDAHVLWIKLAPHAFEEHHSPTASTSASRIKISMYVFQSLVALRQLVRVPSQEVRSAKRTWRVTGSSSLALLPAPALPLAEAGPPFIHSVREPPASS